LSSVKAFRRGFFSAYIGVKKQADNGANIREK